MRKLKITVKELNKSFKKKVILKDLNLDIFQSESLSIIGESGSGKSILTRCLTGLVEYENGEILFVGTKKQAQDIVQQEADRCSMFYIVERWLGGTLTNFSTIKKSIKRLKQLEKEGSNLYENMTKKEIQMLNREKVKLSDQHRGIKDMRRLPDALVVVDAQYEDTAIKEAKRLDIPVIAIVDSNTDPNKVDYAIPANDDSMRTIQLIISSLADSVIEERSSGKDVENGKELEEKLEKSNGTDSKVISEKGKL